MLSSNIFIHEDIFPAVYLLLLGATITGESCYAESGDIGNPSFGMSPTRTFNGLANMKKRLIKDVSYHCSTTQYSREKMHF